MAVYSVRLMCDEGARDVFVNSLYRAIDLVYEFRKHHRCASYKVYRRMRMYMLPGTGDVEMFSSEIDKNWTK